jgi:C4-dicarboxylate-specific signal transduction histidine kinase
MNHDTLASAPGRAPHDNASGLLQPGLNRIDRYLCRLPPAVAWSIAFVLIAAIAASDYVTGYDMSLAVLYLAPIFIIAWTRGRHAGILMSMVCTVSWSLSVLLMQPQVADPLLQIWDGGIQFAMFVLFSIVIAKLRTALAHADDRFAAVLEGMDAAVYVSDEKTDELLYGNERFRASFPPGCEPPALPRDQWQGEFHDSVRGQWFLMHTRAMRWVDGRPVRLVVATNITERKRGEAIFHEQQEKIEANARFVAVGEMASTLAHELNQPLAAVVNYSMGCVRRLRSGAQWNVAELLEMMEKTAAQAERAGKVLQRVRGFVGRRAPALVRCDFNEVIRNIMPMLLNEAQQHSADISLELAPQPAVVRGDTLLLEQVILNLARNALEAMGDTPAPERRLTIRSHVQDSAVVAEFIDRGRGIDPQLEAHLFTPFFSTKARGTGLGLHICRSIVEAHGGRLWMSRNAERGATFHVSLGTAG